VSDYDNVHCCERGSSVVALWVIVISGEATQGRIKASAGPGAVPNAGL